MKCIDEYNEKNIKFKITTGQVKRRDFRELLDEFYNGDIEIGLYTSTNEKDEQVIIEITNEYLKASICQNNGWFRTNIYHKDHIVEELYER